MKTVLASAALAVLTLAACGTGGAKVSKGGAATAAYDTSKLSSSQSPTPAAGATGNCAKGGTAKTEIGQQGITTGTNVEVTQTVVVTLVGCSQDGKTFTDGKLSVSQEVKAGSGSASVNQHLVGKLVLTGEVSDTLDIDLTQSVSAGGSGASSQVSVILDGRVVTSSDTYVYKNEQVSITPGQIEIKH